MISDNKVNETARVLCAIDGKEPTHVVDILVKAGVSLLPTHQQVEDLRSMLESFQATGLVFLTRRNGAVDSAIRSELGDERAREVLTGQDREPK